MAGVKPAEMREAGNWRSFPGNLGGRLLWECRRIRGRMGWPALAGLACGGMSLLLLWHAQDLFLRQKSLAKELRASQSVVSIKPGNEGMDHDVERQLAAFYAYLPSHDMIPDQLKQLVNLAEKSGVTLSRAEYKPQPELNAAYLRYQIVLPLKAEYPKVQAFILTSLQELPTLILESVVFKRERIESNEVEARIQYVLLVKKPLAKGRRQ